MAVRKRPSISGVFLTSMIVIALASTVTMGVILLVDQVRIFRRELDTLRTQSLESQKTLLKSEVERTKDYIDFKISTTEKRLMRDVKSRTEEAWSVATRINDLYGGSRSRSDVERMVTDVLRSILFDGGKGYYFAADMQGTNRLFVDHPEREGQSLIDMRDTEGRPVMRDLVAIAKKDGEGYYRYTWTKPGAEGEGFQKIAFVRLFKPFGWFIGTGAYIQDVQAEIQQEVLSQISSIHFGKDGYVFAGTYEGVSLTAPAQGRNMYDVVDANGVKIVQELIAAARAGGGFVTYVMPKLGGKRDAPKLSYTLAVPEWKWYIGAGMYVDEMEALVAARRASLERAIRLHVTESAALLLGLFVLILAVARAARRRIRSSMDAFTLFFDKAATGAARIDPDQVGFLEFSSLAVTANTMVDQRLLAEKKLMVSEERYRTIVENISDALFILNAHRRILDVNENSCRLFGYSREELVGADLSLLEGGKGETEGRESMQQLLRAGVLVFETDYRRRDGTMIPVEVSAKVVTSDGDGINQAFVRDISARRLAEKDLRESEELLRTLMDNMAAGVMIVDEQSHVIERVNPATAEMLGVSAGSIEGRHCQKFLCPAEAHACPITNLGQEVDRSDRVLLDPNGRSIPVIKSVKRMMIHGRSKLVETFIDITDRKRAEEERRKLEEQVRQTQKLESLGILAGGIAHDFNNILMTVMGNAELALDGIPLLAPARENIAQIETAARRAAELCRQMLAYSGKATFVQEPVDLRALIQEMAQLLASSVSRKARLNLLLDDGLPCLLGDPSQIRQVVMNLIINSSEAIGDCPGVITVSASAVHCDAESPRSEVGQVLPGGLYVRLEVSDTGCGMDAATRDRIFDPFFTTKFKGRGLGLAAVLGIVRAHRGAMKLASEPGKGTTFTLMFPAKEPSDEETGMPKVELSAAQWTGTLLLVDDEKSLRDLGSQMFARLGFTVLTASDGVEAVEVFRRRREVDIVVLDLTMPRMDGAETLAALREIDPSVLVLFASGHSEEDVAGRFSDKGISGVLQKPYTMSRLREAVGRVLPRTGS